MDGEASAGAVAKGLIKCNPNYLVSPVGILKLIEAVSSIRTICWLVAVSLACLFDGADPWRVDLSAFFGSF